MSRERPVGRCHDIPLTKAGACGNCDTSLPVQRRHEMARTGAIEMCEACGVLLYAAE